jgi:predicted dehydrogenase
LKVGNYEISEQVPLPPKSDYGIGIVGCGGIVNYAHLPAYRANRLNILTCCDLDRAAAEQTARQHNIPVVADSLAALLANPAVQIVDIAVPAQQQLGVVEQVAAAHKPMLCQKPLSTNYADAARIVELARQAGVKLAVNQQMRWDAGIRVAHQLIEAGAIGEPTDARIQVNIKTPWDMWPWLAFTPQLEVMYHSIHYIDSVRYLFGEPEFVSSFHTRYPGQKALGETKTLSVLEYASGLQVLIDAYHSNWSDDISAIFRFSGTEGIIKGTIGLLYDYPNGRPDTLQFQRREGQPGEWQDVPLQKKWIPDAFIGPMASLMEAVQTGGEPLTSGADNLKTFQVAQAAYRSAAEHRAVTPGEIAAKP